MTMRGGARWSAFASAVALSALLMTGCYNYSLATGVPADGIERVARGSTFFWGLMGHRHVAQECPLGLSHAKTYMPWWSVIPSALTLGIVTPWRAEYECAAPQLVGEHGMPMRSPEPGSEASPPPPSPKPGGEGSQLPHDPFSPAS